MGFVGSSCRGRGGDAAAGGGDSCGHRGRSTCSTRSPGSTCRARSRGLVVVVVVVAVVVAVAVVAVVVVVVVVAAAVVVVVVCSWNKLTCNHPQTRGERIIWQQPLNNASLVTILGHPCQSQTVRLAAGCVPGTSHTCEAGQG